VATTLTGQPGDRHLPARPDEGRTRPRWGWPQYLALLGAPILLWEIWTLTAWLADGPFQISQFQDRNSTNWWAAHISEAVVLAPAALVLIHVVRDCLRQRELFTLKVMWCIVGATLFWGTNAIQFFTWTIQFSSNYVNVNDPCGHMPLIVNPDCGRAPNPWLFFGAIEVFCLLGAALVMDSFLKRLRARKPHLSNGRIVLYMALAAVAIEIAQEVPPVALGLWSYVPGPLSIPLGDYRYLIIEPIAGGIFFVTSMVLWCFKDDKGRILVERGLEHYAPRKRKMVTFMALYFILQFVTWVPVSGFSIVYGFYQTNWQKVPAYVLNDICDGVGVEGTRYGECPGSPGFRMPGRTSEIPGESP
jgi:hypothetical protein